jgi:hypothetical protein
MAAVDEGIERVASDRHSNRCSGFNARGHPCGAWALRGQEVCLRHSMTEEEWRAFGARGGRKRQKDRRRTAGLRDSQRHRHDMPGPTLARAIEVIGELLDSTLPGSTEPNMEERSWGVLALAQLFRLQPEQKAETLKLLAQVRPKLAVDPQRQRLLDLERAGAALVRACREGRISALDLPPELLGLATAEEETALPS